MKEKVPELGLWHQNCEAQLGLTIISDMCHIDMTVCQILKYRSVIQTRNVVDLQTDTTIKVSV